MSRKDIKKFLKRVDAKKNMFGAFTITILMVLIAFSSIIVIIPEQVKAAHTDFSYSVGITIDNTKINADLTNFPVWVYNTSSNFSSNILTNCSDIAFYDSTNNTQFNHEIEVWDNTTGELGVWVNVTSISSSADTVFYMYYGDSDKGSDRNHNPTGVWDSSYVMVLHFNESSGSVNDSTAYGNDGDVHPGDSGIFTYGQSGPCGNALFADTDSTHTRDGGAYINCSSDASLDNLSETTMTCWINITPNSGGQESGRIYSKAHDQVGELTKKRSWVSLALAAGGVWDGNIQSEMSFSTTSALSTSINNTLNNGSWYCIGLTLNSSKEIGLYSNGTKTANYSNPAWSDRGVGTLYDDSGMNVYLLNRLGVDAEALANNSMNCTIDEFRISNIERNDSWIKASYNTMNDPLTFLTFGGEEAGGVSSSFTLSGLDGESRITWSGEAGETVWSNATTCGTLEINYYVNASDNCTEIRINLTDIDVGQGILSGNISLVFDDNNASWSTVTVAYSGTNVTINESVWDAQSWCGGTNPFPIDGAGWTNGTIYCHFTLAIPSGASSNTYTQDDWKVWWKTI